MHPLFLLYFLLSLVVADPYGDQEPQPFTIISLDCTYQNHVYLNATNPMFSLDATQGIANTQVCVYNFTFPMEYAAEISIDGWYLNAGTVTIQSIWYDDLGFNYTQGVEMPNANKAVNDSLYLMWPPTSFQLTIHTWSWGSMSLFINVTLKTIPDEEPTFLNAEVNQQPYFLQLVDWPVDTAIAVQSTSSGQLAIIASYPGDSMGYEYTYIFIYYGPWKNRQLLGTLDSVMDNNNWLYSPWFFVSSRDTLTFYRAMAGGIPGTVMVNDYENMKNLSYFQITWAPLYPPYNIGMLSLDASRGLAALTVLDDPSGSIFLEKVKYQTCDDPSMCPKYINYTSPIKLLAGGIVRDYDTQGTLLETYRDPTMFDDRNYPQFIPGPSKTYVLEEGMAEIHYTRDVSSVKYSDALDGRNGFIMSDNYPFEAIDQYSEFFVLNSVDGNVFTFEYNITAESPEGHGLLFTVTDTSGSNTFRVDLHNITTPATFNVTALYMNMTMITTTFDAANETSTGTYIPFRIYSTSSTSATEPPSTTTTSLTTTTEPTDATASGTTSTPPMAPWKIVLICLGTILFIILIVLLILFLRYRIRRGKYRKFWATMSGVLPIAVKVDEWELGDKQLEIFEDKELGRGAFGIVYEGELYGDRPVDRIIRSMQKMMTEEKEQNKVAVKRLPLNADNQARLDFTEEISFIKKLGYHPHILGMIGCITAGTSMPVIVLDYCHNGDLLSWVRKNKYSTEMKPEQLLSIAWQISDGLCYLKALNLIHRDLAARNILLTEDLVAKISDFGLCRKPENSEDSATYLPHFYVSRGGRLPVKWLAPESLRDFRFSFKTDLWSYGVILWEMYTFGDVPFGDVNPLNLFELLESGERLPQCGIPDPIYKLMSVCWDEIPGKRTPIEKIKEILHEMILTSSSNNYGYLTISADDGALQWLEEEAVATVDESSFEEHSQHSEEV